MALTPEQLDAVTTPGPLAVIAAAGSGKTSVLVERYVRLLKQGCSPYRILAVTFTTDAAQELRSRILAFCQELPSQTLDALRKTPAIGTIHSFCYRVLMEYSSVLSLPPVKRILDPMEWFAIVGEEYPQWLRDLPTDTLSRLFTLLGEGQLVAIAKLLYGKNLAPPRESPEKEHWEFISNAFDPLINRLQSRLLKEGVYTFDDLESLCEKILVSSAPTCLDIQNRFDALLVDEYQDTSRKQYSILRHLVGPEHHKLFVVGDPRQSIYRFRNAEVALFNQTVEGIVSQAGTVVNLTTNFRSQPALLDHFNHMASVWFQDNSPMQPGRSPTGHTRALNTLRYTAEPSTPESVQAEIAAVVGHVRSLLDAQIAPTDIAILFRSSDRIPIYERSLQNAGVVVSCRRTVELFQSHAVIDISMFLKALADPMNDYCVSGFLRSDFVGYSAHDLWALTRQTGECLFHKLMTRRDLRTSWFVSLVESGDWDLSNALATAMSHAHNIAAAPSTAQCLQSLFKLAHTVPEAVELIERWNKQSLLYCVERSDGEGLSLATVHSVKGLEYSHILLVDLARRPPHDFPCIRFDSAGIPVLRWRENGAWVNSARYEAVLEDNATKDDQESLRVLYVALTRARETVTVFLPANTEKLPARSWAKTLSDILTPPQQ